MGGIFGSFWIFLWIVPMSALLLPLLLHLLFALACAVRDLDLPHERPENFHLQHVQLFNKTFFVGSVHHDWVQQAEMGNLQALDRALKGRENKCVAADVGMNDGFYTQLAAQYGCKVYSFEVQESCIALSRKAVTANNVSHLVNIFRNPVSRFNGESLRFPHGSAEHQNRCDGMNSIQGHSHKKYTIEGYHHFHAVSLDGLFPFDTTINFLKVDVEGFDPAVVEGAMALFSTHRILHAVIEIQSGFWPNEEILKNITPYKRIIEEFGYKFRCVTERPKNTDWDVVRTDLTYPDFEKYVRSNACVDWEFYI
jgi:FkbM family methyltransferase